MGRKEEGGRGGGGLVLVHCIPEFLDHILQLGGMTEGRMEGRKEVKEGRKEGGN
jgi:hypothetical protein